MGLANYVALNLRLCAFTRSSFIKTNFQNLVFQPYHSGYLKLWSLAPENVLNVAWICLSYAVMAFGMIRIRRAICIAYLNIIRSMVCFGEVLEF